MTPEELLRPRYKVVATWPCMQLEPFRLGQIVTLQPHKEEDAEGFIYMPYMHKPGKFMWQSFFTLFPHLFKELQWWEERKPEEMPEYVKVIREDCVNDTGLYCKVYRWSVFDEKISLIKGQYGAELEGYSPLYLARTELNFPGQVYGRLNATHLQPATCEEYQAYQKTTTEQ